MGSGAGQGVVRADGLGMGEAGLVYLQLVCLENCCGFVKGN